MYSNSGVVRLAVSKIKKYIYKRDFKKELYLI